MHGPKDEKSKSMGLKRDIVFLLLTGNVINEILVLDTMSVDDCSGGIHLLD